MEKHTFGKEYGCQTRAVHPGNDVDAETGAIKRPITMANSYAPVSYTHLTLPTSYGV